MARTKKTDAPEQEGATASNQEAVNQGPLFIVKDKGGKIHSDALPKEKAQAVMDRFVKEATADGKSLDLFLLEVEDETNDSPSEENHEEN